MTRYLSLLLVLVLLAGCRSKNITTPLVPQNGFHNFEIGKPMSITVGEHAVMLIDGPYREYFQANGDLIFNGLPLIPMGSLWDAREKNAEGKGIFLTRKDFFNEAIAIWVDKDGKLIDKEKGARQIKGVKTWRSWPYIGNKKQCFKKSGNYSLAGKGFKVYYLGEKDKKLRFYISTFSNRGALNLSNEKLDNMEYLHDLNSGKTFTIRGITIRIDRVDEDGKLHYTVVKENRISQNNNSVLKLF